VSQPDVRTSVRIILVDPTDRVLLLGAQDPDDRRTVWFMPGGGVEADESLIETAARELQEEIGVTGLEFTGPVWIRRHDYTWDGQAVQKTEWYFVARLGQTIATERIRPLGIEGDYFVGARWLTVDEIGKSGDDIAPRRLAQLLPPVLAGDFPAQPIETGI
jgi:8-oxo-dGTP pyrophosphatase MutT (NUDIX family)